MFECVINLVVNVLVLVLSCMFCFVNEIIFLCLFLFDIWCVNKFFVFKCLIIGVKVFEFKCVLWESVFKFIWFLY